MRTRGNGKSAKKKKRVAYSSQPAHLIQFHKITNHMLYMQIYRLHKAGYKYDLQIYRLYKAALEEYDLHAPT
jgi:hypothetical protein